MIACGINDIIRYEDYLCNNVSCQCIKCNAFTLRNNNLHGSVMHFCANNSIDKARQDEKILLSL